jgi:beta-xylosidase
VVLLCHDEFSGGALSPCWEWVNEDPTQWSLAERPGYLRLRTHPGWVGDKNLLLQTPPTGDLIVTTELAFAPTQNYQGAGLVAWGGAGNYLFLTHAFCDTAPPECVGDGLYFDHVEGGTLVGSNFATASPPRAPLVLRLERVGDTYNAHYSTDGVHWTLVGSHIPGFPVLGVGLAAASDLSGASIPADFDYFRLAAP